jgi:hypothetical protein
MRFPFVRPVGASGASIEKTAASVNEISTFLKISIYSALLEAARLVPDVIGPRHQSSATLALKVVSGPVANGGERGFRRHSGRHHRQAPPNIPRGRAPALAGYFPSRSEAAVPS